MTSYSGSFTGTIRAQSTIALTDQPNHTIGVAGIRGTQKSTDPKWDNSTITYWGITDVSGTQGTQRGYFVNDHGKDGRDLGTFEGKVSVADGQFVVEGKYQYTGGEGSFAGITGAGTFKTKLTSPTTVEATWQGAYEIAGTRAHSA